MKRKRRILLGATIWAIGGIFMYITKNYITWSIVCSVGAIIIGLSLKKDKISNTDGA